MGGLIKKPAIVEIDKAPGQKIGRYIGRVKGTESAPTGKALADVVNAMPKPTGINVNAIVIQNDRGESLDFTQVAIDVLENNIFITVKGPRV